MDKNEKKVWGFYSTYKNPKEIASLSEEDIWKRIDNLSRKLFLASQDRECVYSKRQLLLGKYNLEYLIYLTRQFGVEFNVEPTESIQVENSPSFQSWFSFWKNHFANMSQDDYEDFIEAKQNGSDVSMYLPAEPWNMQKNTK